MIEPAEMRLLIVRHGETEVNRQGRMQGVPGASLNEAGRGQLARTAERLSTEGITAVYASDLARARQSAEIVAARIGLTVATDTRLREQDFGDWEGVLWEDVASLPEIDRYLGDLEFAPPGGETKRSLLDRVVECTDSLLARHLGETVLVVSHGGPLMVFMYHALGIPYGPQNRFYGANGGLTEFGRRDGVWRLHSFNETFFLR